MANYERKAKVISSGLVKKYKQVSRALFADYVLHDTGVVIHSNLDESTAVEMRSFYLSECPEDWHEAKLVADSQYHQSARLQKRIRHMLQTSPQCVFVTLTFRDDVLAKTSAETRHRYVARWLKSQCERYVANIDYGKQNEREHYHAVTDCRVDPLTWQYGALNCKPIRYNPLANSSVKLAKYVAKLTCHAVKETSKRCHLIYSRRV